MTNPEERNDPWKEALECYEDFADEVVVVGQTWPKEFSFEYIGSVFQDGFNKSNGDWVILMDVDTFFHERDKEKINNVLKKYEDYPSVAFPKFQFFHPERYNLKSKMCIALNKKNFPNIKFTGGPDLCQPTVEGQLIKPDFAPYEKIVIWNYEAMFRTKDIIKKDRSRFARAWFNSFSNYGDRGGPTQEEAFEAWFKMIEDRYSYHYLKMKIDNHPKYIKNRLRNIPDDQFGSNLFGLISKNEKFNLAKFNQTYKNYIKNYLLVK
tara:strand:- start:256 stop:1050 length:795 start_codon:yes stop_codon:yes gene_type:complete